MKKQVFCITLLSLTLAMGGCSGATSSHTPQDFDAMALELYKEAVSQDSLSLNFSLTDPSIYDISIEPTLGSITDFDSTDTNQELKKELLLYEYDDLSLQQQQTYDVLLYVLDTETDYANTDLLYYDELLYPTTGIQNMLPILLSEFNFYTTDDVETYLALLKDIPRYFNELLDYEKTKSEKGLFMCDTLVDMVISECEDFISSAEDNLLITTLSGKLDSLESLTPDQRQTYLSENQTLVTETVLPAYETLMEGLKALKGTGTNVLGLAGFPEGKTYYQYLIDCNLGLGITADELITRFDDAIASALGSMSMVIATDPTVIDDFSEALATASSDPMNDLLYLQTAINEDFYEPVTTEFDLKYVDESLRDSASPAFYVIPPIDDYTRNVIYVNSDPANPQVPFTTLAHEGFPGHLYQQTAFAATNPAPLRTVLNFTGYSEGWGLYAELYAYKWDHHSETVNRLLELNSKITMLLYGRLDLGINYEGWDMDTFRAFISPYFEVDDALASELFYTLAANPANYLFYSGGALQIETLREYARDTMGADFDLKAFHKFIAEFGNAPFTIIEKHLNTWMESRTVESLPNAA